MICPKCFSKLTKVNKSYICINNHNYDISKEGYINLLLSKTNAGDNKDLIEGRINFLKKDYYKPLVLEIINILKEYNDLPNINLCDCGCGIGYYSRQLKESFNNINIYGTDISKDAIKYAAKSDKNTTYIVSSNQKIPFEDKFFDILIHIFSPVFIEEAKRIIKDDGILIIVSPGKKHLYELKELLYSSPYYNKIEEENYLNFNKIISKNLIYKIDIDCATFHDLIKMTPYYYKTKKEDINKISFDDTISITIDFIISCFKPF